jgi:hypothetical protein
MGERKSAFRVLVGKLQAKRQLRRPLGRWEDNNKMHLREVGCGDKDWIDLVRDRGRWRSLVNAVINLRVP